MNHGVRAIFAALMILAPGSLVGQARPTRVPLTIAMVNELPHPGAPAEIHRQPSGPVLDVLLVSIAITPEQLSEAIQGVLTARYADGDTASRSMVLRVAPDGPTSAHRRVFPWVQRVLTDLRRAPEQPLSGVGPARTVVIWLPPQRVRRGRGSPPG